jgi:hypothetical protein
MLLQDPDDLLFRKPALLQTQSSRSIYEATTEQRMQVIYIVGYLQVGDSPDAPKVAPKLPPIQSGTEPETQNTS